MTKYAEASTLSMIPKAEKIVEYTYDIIAKLPRVEKYNIGTEVKNIAHSIMKSCVRINKVDKLDRMKYCNLLDSDIILSKVYIRLMYRQKYISEKQYMYYISILDELGKMLGGYIKSLNLKDVKENK